MCGCHNNGMISCSGCCDSFTLTNKEPIDKTDIVMDRCIVCLGSGIMFRPIRTLFKEFNIQRCCKECDGKGYIERVVV